MLPYITPMELPFCESRGRSRNAANCWALAVSAPMPPPLAANFEGSAATVPLTPMSEAEEPVKKTFRPKAASAPLVSLAKENVSSGDAALICNWLLTVVVALESVDAVQCGFYVVERGLMVQSVEMDVDVGGLRQTGFAVGDQDLKASVLRRKRQTGVVKRFRRIADGSSAVSVL